MPKSSSCDWTLDNDDDGIPDCAESSDACATYAGLHYHSWGARKDQRDIFIEIDYLRGDKGELEMTYVTPTKQMIDAVIRTYESDFTSYKYPIKLHADVGNLLTPDLKLAFSPITTSCMHTMLWSLEAKTYNTSLLSACQ